LRAGNYARSLVVATALVAVMTACSSTGSSEEWIEPELPASVPEFSDSSSLPFDAYHLSDADLEHLQVATAQLIKDCSARYGVETAFKGDYLRPANASTLMWGGRFGTLTLDHAARYGYHAAPGESWAPVGGFYIKDPSNLTPNATEPAEQVVFFGPETNPAVEPPIDPSGQPVPAGGCMQLVQSRIDADLISDAYLTSDLINLSLEHKAVKEAVARWSDCMAAAGYDFDLIQDGSEKFTGQPVSTEEIETASDDVTCTRSSGWADTFYTILGAYESQAIDRRPQDLEAVLSSQTLRLDSLEELGSER